MLVKMLFIEPQHQKPITKNLQAIEFYFESEKI